LTFELKFVFGLSFWKPVASSTNAMMPIFAHDRMMMPACLASFPWLGFNISSSAASMYLSQISISLVARDTHLG